MPGVEATVTCNCGGGCGVEQTMGKDIEGASSVTKVQSTPDKRWRSLKTVNAVEVGSQCGNVNYGAVVPARSW